MSINFIDNIKILSIKFIDGVNLVVYTILYRN